MELSDLFPGCGHGAFLPAAVAADGRAAEEDPVVGPAEYREPFGVRAATACRRPEAVLDLFPPDAIARLVLGANLRVHLARVREHVFDASLDGHVRHAGHSAVAVEPEQHTLVAEESA